MSGMNTEERSFIEAIESHRLITFSGAGISLASNVPGAAEIFDATIRHLLPHHYGAIHDYQNEIGTIGANGRAGKSMYILPEEMYTLLLHLSERPSECLNMFRCLLPDNTIGYKQYPSFTHLFAVANAYESNLPVFTVNFDTVFEQACTAMGLEFQIFSFNDAHAYEASMQSGKRMVRICKVHGDIGRCLDKGAVTADIIKTTDKGIAEPSQWAGVISTLIHNGNNIAMMGYSGRDVDLYPAIRSATAAHPASLLWFDNFTTANGRITAQKVKECLGIGISQYPSEILPTVCKDSIDLFFPSLSAEQRSFLAEQCDTAASFPDTTQKTLQLRCLNTCIQRVPHVDEDILYASLLQQCQLNDETHDFLERLFLAPNAHAMSVNKQQALLGIRMLISRERADFLSYQRCAKSLMKIHRANLRFEKQSTSQQPTSITLATFADAWLQLISSYQMRIPNFDTSVVQPNRLEAALTAVLSCYVDIRFRMLLSWIRRIVSTLPSTDDAEALLRVGQETENRLLALEFGVLRKIHLPSAISGFLENPLRQRLFTLGLEAERITNTNTLKGVLRRIDKLQLFDVREPDFQSFAKRWETLYSTFPDRSQANSTVRANSSLAKNSHIEELRQIYNDDKAIGNALNVVKDLIVIASVEIHTDGRVSTDIYDAFCQAIDHDYTQLTNTFLLRLALRRYRKVFKSYA